MKTAALILCILAALPQIAYAREIMWNFQLPAILNPNGAAAPSCEFLKVRYEGSETLMNKILVLDKEILREYEDLPGKVADGKFHYFSSQRVRSLRAERSRIQKEMMLLPDPTSAERNMLAKFQWSIKDFKMPIKKGLLTVGVFQFRMNETVALPAFAGTLEYDPNLEMLSLSYPVSALELCIHTDVEFIISNDEGEAVLTGLINPNR